MESRQENASEPARAYPVCDAQEPRLTPVISEQRLPRQERARLKKRVQKLRIGTLKIKWWKLEEEEVKVKFKEKVMIEVRPKEDANEWWEETSQVIRKVAEEVLGKTSGKGTPQGKDTWWWNEEV